MQGVGFRPYVYRLVGELGLDGWVLNDARGVLVEVEGEEPAVEAFLGPAAARGAAAGRRRARRSPSSARRPASAASPSARARPPGSRCALVSPDTATCADCLRELFDPADRRYRYPFVNCTNCGPRFTIVRGVPYDRPLTTMAGFAMCDACRAEYEDPARPPLPRPAERVPRLRPARPLADATGADVALEAPPTRWRRRRRAAAPGRSWRSRASAATTSPAAPTTRTPSPRCARASTARTSRSR